MNISHAAAADLVLTNAVEQAQSDIKRGLSVAARYALADAIRVADRLLAVA